MRLYYKIWVDLITRARSIPANQENWAISCMMFMTVPMTFNLGLAMILFQKYVYGSFFYTLSFSTLPKYASNVISFLILFMLPCLILNYLLIFRQKRYERLLQKYRSHNGKLFPTYILISMLLPVVLVLLSFILQSNE